MILQVVGLILAFQTRKVEVTGLNSAKFVASLVYTSSILLVILSVVVFSMREFINFTAAIFDGGILLMAGLFLGLTFLPMVGQGIVQSYITCFYCSRYITCTRILRGRRYSPFHVHQILLLKTK